MRRKDRRAREGRNSSRHKSFGERSPKGRFSRDSGRSELEMHEVVCDKCGVNTTVPFKPTASKPVYCRDCFGRKGGRERPSFGNKSENSTDGLAKINRKLDKIMRALEID